MLQKIVLVLLLLPLAAFAQTATSIDSETLQKFNLPISGSTKAYFAKPEPKKSKLKPTHIEYMRYEENVFGQSRLSEIGDALEFDLAVRKDFSENTFLRLGVEVDPQENNLTKTGESRAQRFDIFMHHRVGNFTLQAEFELDTIKNTSSSSNSSRSGLDVGGINLGFDDDSEGSFISYDAFNRKVRFSFFPFNFDSEVGDEFNSWDVARMYFIEGAPSTIEGPPSESESIENKTIPGVSIRWRPNPELSMTIGGGVASYLFPTNPNFNITGGSTSNSWERRQNVGAKANITYSTPLWRAQAEYAWHNNDLETGSLLKAAGSLTGALLLGNTILSTEVAMSQAGRRAYKLARGSRWFQDVANFYPIYTSQFTGRRHSWLGKTDFAYMLKAGYRVNDNFVPYAFYKFQGKDFIFREEESAHRLRSFDDDLSHGGLHRIGLGAQFEISDFIVRPNIEYRQAANAVFNKSAGIQDDQLNSDFRKTDYLFSLVVIYQLEDRSLWGWWRNKGEGVYGQTVR